MRERKEKEKEEGSELNCCVYRKEKHKKKFVLRVLRLNTKGMG
jgi:hypothetical protein